MGHVAVFRYEGRIIEVNESVADGREEYPGDCYKEQDAEDAGTAGGGGVAEGIGNRGGPRASGCREMP